MISARKVLVPLSLTATVLASASAENSVSMKVNVKPGDTFAYACSISSVWNREGVVTIDTKVVQTGQMALKVKSKKNSIYTMENTFIDWRSVSEGYRNGTPGWEPQDDYVVKSRIKDGTINFQVNSQGKILDTFDPSEWPAAFSVVLPFPSKTVGVGDPWTNSLPMAPGTDRGNMKVVYEVFERRAWKSHDILAIQFSSEPMKNSKTAVSGLVYVDTKTDMTVKGQIHSVFAPSGSADVVADIKLELVK